MQEDETKDAFYEEPERIIASIPPSDVIVPLGDFNAQVGRESCFASVAGIHSLHDESNDNGCRVANFAISNGLVIKSAQFQRKDIHKVTWTSSDNRTQTQIDHVLIDKRFSHNIVNARSYRGTTHESDHALVKITLRCKWPRLNGRRRDVRPKFNVDKLKDKDTSEKTDTRVDDMNEMAHQNVDIVATAANEILGEVTSRRHSVWFDDECKAAVEAKKNARLQTTQRRTRRTLQEYSRRKTEAYRLLRKKKREHLNREIQFLESLNRIGNVREFYRIIKVHRKGFQTRTNKIKDNDRELLGDTDGIIRRWKDYFQNLLSKPPIPRARQNTYQRAEPLIEAPTYDEVIEAVNRLKTRKSPGEDKRQESLIDLHDERA